MIWHCVFFIGMCVCVCMSVCAHMYVCVFYVHVHMGFYTHVFCVCMMAKGQCQKSSSVARYLTFLETGSLWTWSSLTELVAGQWTHWSVCLCFPQGWACRCMLPHLTFCMDARHPNLGPPPCSLRTSAMLLSLWAFAEVSDDWILLFHESMLVVCLGIRPFPLGYLIFWCTSVKSFLL